MGPSQQSLGYDRRFRACSAMRASGRVSPSGYQPTARDVSRHRAADVGIRRVPHKRVRASAAGREAPWEAVPGAE
ncbi:hypothetical protein ALMP_53190 [Streptomyces sp. A012304]|nr:hypothetical protein ALMP_53190 [Streptomyces sp. A012304]